jgi:murein L,D-transpeptidase YcbB/YkuD
MEWCRHTVAGFFRRDVIRRACFAGLLVLVSGCGARDDARATDDIARLTAASPPTFVEHGRRGAQAWKDVVRFYTARQHHPAWIAGGRPTAALDALLGGIKLAGGHGLDPVDYDVEALAAERRLADDHWFQSRFAEERVAEIDVRTSYAFIRLGRDLIHGRLRPGDVDSRWKAEPSATDVVGVLEEALANDRVADALAELAPHHPQYLALQQALTDYRRRSGTKADRDVDGVSNDWRVRQIEMNLERWRWMPRELGDRHILVNIPAYEMQVVEADTPVVAMRVIVGAPDTPTPVFSDRMTFVTFSPYWNIPETIMRAETVPRAMTNPEYLENAGIEVVRVSGGSTEPVDPSDVDWSVDLSSQGLRLRQVPGPDNALGLVKFIFPNHFNVYLHDTPGDALFARSKRALSHGCIRIEKPVALARYVLRDRAAWTDEKISAAMHANRESIVRLKEPIAVHLGYWTAWVQGGRVRFTADPYGVDRKQARLDQASLGRRGRSSASAEATADHRSHRRKWSDRPAPAGLLAGRYGFGL